VVLRIMDSVAIVITASAGIIIFIAVPFALLDRWHLLPKWDIFWLFFAFAPVVMAWDRLGPYLMLIVAVCELSIVAMRPEIKKTKIIAVVFVAICLLAYLWLYAARRFNIH
jgi:hypothetical protein